jgi:hypothetical protein
MIISILGMAGEFKGKFTSAYYGCEILGKESKEYRNSTDVLVQNYDDKFENIANNYHNSAIISTKI